MTIVSIEFFQLKRNVLHFLIGDSTRYRFFLKVINSLKYLNFGTSFVSHVTKCVRINSN